MRHRTKVKEDTASIKKTSKKKILLKAVVILLIVLVVLAGAAFVAWYYFMNSTGTGPSPAGKHNPGQAIKKTETVYVDNHPSGQVKSVVVDTYLRNNPEKDDIVDRTNLKNIVNINGNEQYTNNGNGTITWPTNGTDIYYEGEASTEDIPVTMKVKYYLDGKRIKGRDLDGKSGKLEIHIKYYNKKKMKIRDQNVNVPFLVMSALIVNDNSLKKLKINHGKVINQAGVKVAVGISAPGLTEKLGKSVLEKDFGTELIIKGTADNFKGNEIISVVSNDMLKYISKKSLNKLNMDKKITRLDTATKKIRKGSNKLYKGISLVNSRMPELTKGTAQAAAGAKKLEEGTNKFLAEMHTGSLNLGKLGEAIHETVVYIDGITSDTVDEQGKVTEKGTVSKSKDVQTTVNELSTKMEAANMTTSEIERLREVIKADTTMSEGDRTEMLAYLDVMDYLAGSKEDLSKNANDVAGDVDEIDHILDGQKAGEDLTPFLKDLIDKMEDADQLKREDGTYMGLVDATKLWNDKNGEMSTKLSEQADVSKKGSLSSGAKELAQGMRKIDTGSIKLAKGVKRLDKGSKRLSKGINKYYEKAIKKIVNLYNDKLAGIAKEVKAMKEAGDQYNNYSGITNEMDGSVTFMYFTPMGKW